MVEVEALLGRAQEFLTTALYLTRSTVRQVLGNPERLPVYQQKGTAEADVPYLEAIIVFTLCCFLLELTLDIRQYMRLRLDKPPETLTRVLGEIDAGNKKDANAPSMLSAILAKFSASRAYQLDRERFGFVQSFFNQAEATGLVLLGFMPYLWDLSVSLASKVGVTDKNEIWIALIFMGLNLVYEQVVHMPFSLFRTFVIEQRHGFNKQSLGTFFLDIVKSLVLSAVLGGPICAAALWVIQWGGERFYIYLYILVFVFQLVMLTIYPTVIAPLFNKYEPLEDGSLRKNIEALASQVSFPLTKIFVVDGSTRSAHSNAYMYGFGKNKRIVLYDTLLKQAEENEIVAILGHELGHWKRGHTVQMFVVSQAHILALIYMFGQSMSSESLYTSFGFSSRPTLVGLFLFLQTIWAPIDKVLSFLMNVWSRHNEYEADEFAVKLGYSKDLQTGLVKMQIENLGNMNPDPAYSTYHHSHPVLVERLTAMRRRKQD